VTTLLLVALAAHSQGPPPPVPATLADAEARAMLHVRQSFERVGRSAPVPDPALTQAARALAREALLASTPAATGARIAQAVSDAGGWDPNPRLVLIRSWPLDTTLEAFTGRRDFADEAASHAGVALAADGAHAVLALLLAERKAVLQSFPRKLDRAPAKQRLCFELRAPLVRPSVFVTRPSGSVDRLADVSAKGGSGCATVPFGVTGRHALEILGEGPDGPEVAAMLAVEVGAVPPVTAVPEASGPEPATTPEARAQLLLRVNALRATAGVPGVQADARLDAVAQAYADRMATQHFFAHIAPDGETLPDRLEKAGYAYRASGENLGMASGPLAAHLAIEESPGHRKNLLDPAFDRVGFGLAWQSRDGGSEVLLVELLASPAQTQADPVAVAYKRLEQLRSQFQLPALARNAALEAIAARQARSALARDDPRAPDLDSQVFGAVADARTTSADLYVAQDLGALPASRGLHDARYSLVGIGAVRGDSARYGRGRYWVVVILAGLR
jgi:uncharacterized protein YkwD